MSEDIIILHPLRKYWVALMLVFLLATLGSLYISLVFLSPVIDLGILFAGFLGYPLLVTSVAFYIGWHMKKFTVTYRPLEWHFSPVQIEVADLQKLVHEYHKKNIRVEARSNYWIFHLPIIVLVFLFSIPLYISLLDSSILTLGQLFYIVGITLNAVIASVGGFRATSNDASEDFALPLIREALWLAKEQSKTPGISEVWIVLDKAIVGSFSIYREPRVLLRLSSVEEECYVESWSEDLKAVTRVLSRVHADDDHGQVIWWWISRDRHFRKYVSPEDDGYYVNFPVPFLGKELSVRDVQLITRNAVALVLKELLSRKGKHDTISESLNQLGAQ